MSRPDLLSIEPSVQQSPRAIYHGLNLPELEAIQYSSCVEVKVALSLTSVFRIQFHNEVLDPVVHLTIRNIHNDNFNNTPVSAVMSVRPSACNNSRTVKQIFI